MRTKPLALALTAVLGGIASAQPGPPQPIPPMDTGTPVTQDPGPPDPNQVQQVQQPQQQTVVAQQPTQVVEEETTGRPEGLAIAIGFGYGWGPGGTTSLQTPNVTSARLRLAGGIQLEPMLQIQNNTIDRDAMDEETDKVTRFGLGATMRLPMVTHGKVDLELLGSLSFLNQKENPDGDFNTETSNTFSLGYGVGIAYWFSRHWNLSFSAQNPLVSYTSTKVQVLSNMTTKVTDTRIGLTWLPSVFVMIHLYN